jgi:hypothetical protein
MTLLTLSLTAIIAALIIKSVDEIALENISSVIVNIISISLTFVYAGIFVKLRSDT